MVSPARSGACEHSLAKWQQIINGAAEQGRTLMLKALKLASVLVALSTPALAEVNGTLRIGVLNDMSSVYADFQGPGSVLAA
jgi:hypothetical protein